MTVPLRPPTSRAARSPIASLLAIGVVAVLVATGCAGKRNDPALTPAAAAGAPASLLDAVPEPGQAQPPGTVEFAGTTTDGRYGVAVLVTIDGELVAYVCDGDHHGEVFTGKVGDVPAVLTLAGASGSRLVLDLTRHLPAGSLSRNNADLAFALEPADATGGFYRRVRGDRSEAWVLTPAGAIKGVAKQGEEVVGGTDIEGGTLEGVMDPEMDFAEPVLFKKRRCAKLNAEKDALFPAALAGDDVEAFEQFLDIVTQMDRLGCEFT